jgi:putative Mg2+ transporter-C (MgtC) family protein
MAVIVHSPLDLLDMTMLPDIVLASRLLLAALLGSVIGFERGRLLWSAGLRTHMLVCVGSCLIMIVSAYGFTSVLGPHVVLDPSRVAAQVVSGIGFLGAGSIILRNEVVKGLTTAASLWAVAAIGLAVGGGLYFASIAATVIILGILAGLKPIEDHFRDRRQAVQLQLEVRPGEMSAAFLQQVLGWRAARIKQLTVRSHDGSDAEQVNLAVGRQPAKDTEEMIRLLARSPSVLSVDRV